MRSRSPSPQKKVPNEATESREEIQNTAEEIAATKPSVVLVKNDPTPAYSDEDYVTFDELTKNLAATACQEHPFAASYSKDDFDKLSDTDREHFHRYVLNAKTAYDMIAHKNDTYTAEAFAGAMKTADHSLNKLNSRPWIAAGLAVLGAIAFAAGTALALVLGGSLFTATVAATAAGLGASLFFAAGRSFQGRLFPRGQLDGLREVKNELNERHTTSMKASG